MSVVDFRESAARPLLGTLVHGELDGLLEPLSQLERRDVRDMLDLVTLRLAARAEGVRHFRTRLDAVIASLIGVVDAIDGDCDLEPTLAGSPSPVAPDEAEPDGDDERLTATETHGRGFDFTPLLGHDDDEDDDREHEMTDDNGLGDAAGMNEQLWPGRERL